MVGVHVVNSAWSGILPVLALFVGGCAMLPSAGRERDEIDELLKEVRPPARFKKYRPQFSVKKVPFKWTVFRKKTGQTLKVSDEKQVIFDGDRMIGYFYDRNPVFANIRLFSMHPEHVMKIDPLDWADATDFRNYAQDYGESIIFGHVYDETKTEIRGGGETITFVRTDIGKPDGRMKRDVREVNTVTLSVHPQLGYCLTRTKEWQCKPLPKTRHGKPITRIGVGDLWGWGVINPWPGEGTYTQGFFSPGTSYTKGRGQRKWPSERRYALYSMNGPTVEAIRHGWHPKVRHNGLVGYLGDRMDWGVAMSVIGPSDVGAAVCPAWGEFHAAGADLSSEPDADGYWRLSVAHRVVGLPPEIQDHIRKNSGYLFENNKCLAIRLDGEDFEDQPLPFSTRFRTVRFVGRGVEVSTERVRSGKKSIVAKGRKPEELRQLHLHQEHPPVCFDPNRKYHLECWIYIEGDNTEAFVIGANELEVKDHMMFMDKKTIGRSRTASVKTPGKWQKVTLDFTARPYGGLLALGFAAIGPGKAYFDDFRIFKVPERDEAP